jgi:hypothetical protein
MIEIQISHGSINVYAAQREPNNLVTTISKRNIPRISRAFAQRIFTSLSCNVNRNFRKEILQNKTFFENNRKNVTRLNDLALPQLLYLLVKIACVSHSSI